MRTCRIEMKMIQCHRYCRYSPSLVNISTVSTASIELPYSLLGKLTGQPEEYLCLTTIAGRKSSGRFHVEPDLSASWRVAPEALSSAVSLEIRERWRRGEAVGLLTQGGNYPRSSPARHTVNSRRCGGCVRGENQALTAFIISSSASMRQFGTRLGLI